MPAALFEDLGTYHSAQARFLAGRGESARARAALGDAVRMFERAAEIDRAINRLGKERLLRRGLGEGAAADTGTPGIYRKLGWAYLESGDARRAADTLGYLRRIRPGDADSHFVLGVALGGQSEADRARGDVRAAEVRLGLAAVSLIEATLLDPAHDAAWETLERVYGLLAPGTVAVVRAGGRRALNMGHPLVAGHLREACVELVRQLTAAGLDDEAARWRQRMVGEFGLPADLFPLG
jgi:tetratricopeptide (TPR) repeat protein